MFMIKCALIYAVLTVVCLVGVNFRPFVAQLHCLKNDTDVAQRVCYQMVVCYPTSPN